jgi:NADH-quinone oxidoreductase subunit C
MREAQAILAALGRAAPGGAVGETPARELRVSGAELPAVMASLKSLGDFLLLDIDAIDRPDRYELAYRLLDRGGEGGVALFTVRVGVDKAEARLPSIMGVWKAADVMEREVWDLMGVVFEGRTGLKRILCPDDFEGHPLRKDFVVRQRVRFAESGAEGREGDRT